MLSHRITQILQIELIVPISQHSLMAVSPVGSTGPFGTLPVGSKNLNIVHTYGRCQLSMMIIHVHQSRSCVTDCVLCAGFLHICKNKKCFNKEKTELYVGDILFH